MKTNRVRLRQSGLSALLRLGCCGWTANLTARTAFSKMVVFGDSLCDAGNMTALTSGVFPNAPAFAPGRQSNGPVWVEYLAASMSMSDQIVNYAVVGAMTDELPGVSNGNVWTDVFGDVLENTHVMAQIILHLSESGGIADPDALYVLWAGPNDLNGGIAPTVIVQNLLNEVALLSATGAQHIILMNIPDLGKIPRFVGIPELSALLSEVCRLMNAGLEINVPAIEALFGNRIIVVDTFTMLNDFVGNPANSGLSVVNLPFMTRDMTTTPWTPIYTIPGADPEDWLFWDDLHPTTKGHELFAEQVGIELLKAYSPREGRGIGPGTINMLRGLVR